MWRFILPGVLLLLLSSCASGPTFDTQQVDHSQTPHKVATEPKTAKGKIVLWGGVILRVDNLKETTRIEVLAYPLDSNSMPQTSRDSLGRFIFEYSGYLEPASYAAHRLISVVGRVQQVQTGRVGETDNLYPVIIAQQIYLWPKDSERDRTRFHFGIGFGGGL